MGQDSKRPASVATPGQGTVVRRNRRCSERAYSEACPRSQTVEREVFLVRLRPS